MVECDFPECTTFGAVIRFGIELEKGTAAIYEELGNDPRLAKGQETFKMLGTVHKKRGNLLEDTRREKLNEMILEPIQEMRGEKYIIDTKVPPGMDLKAAAKFAAMAEERSSAFYLESSKVAKMLLAEAARIMERLGKENLSNKAKLEAL